LLIAWFAVSLRRINPPFTGWGLSLIERISFTPFFTPSLFQQKGYPNPEKPTKSKHPVLNRSFNKRENPTSKLKNQTKSKERPKPSKVRKTNKERAVRNCSIDQIQYPDKEIESCLAPGLSSFFMFLPIPSPFFYLFYYI
jgi:hypothetical protein